MLWIDPGKVTGLAAYFFREHKCHVMEDGFMLAGNRIGAMCSSWGPQLHIGWEHFSIHPRTPPADAHHAIEMIGVARRAAIRSGCLILPVAQPSDRNVATQAMLERLGWWRPGKKDAQSAAQHLLAWLMRSGTLPDDLAAILAALRS